MKRKRLGPVITIIILILSIIVISAVGSIFGLTGQITKITNGTLETTNIRVKTIFSSDGLKFFFSSPVETFKTFKPLVLLIISLMAISIGKTSGFLKATFYRFRKLKMPIITFLTLFISIISSFFGEYSYVVLIPLVAVIYQYIGKNSLLGVLTAFIGITLGYGAGLVFNFDDYQLGLITKRAATVSIDKDYVFNAWSNSFIMIASTIIISIVGTIIIENILKPKVPEDIKEENDLNISKKGIIISYIIFTLLILIFIYMIIPNLPGSGLFLDKEQPDYVAQLLGSGSLFTDAFLFVLLIIMMICSWIYGRISNNIKDTNDYSVGLSKEFDNLGYIFVLMFFVSLMISILDWTNLDKIITAWLISFISNIELTGLTLIITMMLIIIISSILMPDSIAKWTIAAPILVPLFMKANITPDFTQFVFKAADSIGKSITPFYIYFILMLAFLEKYNAKPTTKITVFGTLRLITPTILLFALIWFVIIIGWFTIGIPIGPNTFPTM